MIKAKPNMQAGADALMAGRRSQRYFTERFPKNAGAHALRPREVRRPYAGVMLEPKQPDAQFSNIF